MMSNSQSRDSYYGSDITSVNGRKRAPRKYEPRRRELETIFKEDSADVTRHADSIFTEDADICVENAIGEPYRCDQWNEMELNPQLRNNLVLSKYIRPRKIQEVVIPYIYEGYSVKCASETGSGKTASFLVPIIQLLIEDQEKSPLPEGSPICLIVAPTRELVTQIFEQAKKFCFETGISVGRAYGQYDCSLNLTRIQNGCNILVACLGRLMDFVENGHIHLRSVRFLVIDEVDRFLDFEEDTELMDLFNWPQLPPKDKRQTLFYSATFWNPKVHELAYEHMDMEKQVFVAAKAESNRRIKYVICAVPSRPAKFRYLIEVLKEITANNEGVCPRTLVFINRKINVDRVAIDITSNGFPATTLHGDRAQDLREEALENFREGKSCVLVATDVCARGVDIKEMDYVINYDLPNDLATFIQRCGRTGRTHYGTAISFYLKTEDENMADVINDHIKASGQEPPEFLLSGVVDYALDDPYVHSSISNSSDYVYSDYSPYELIEMGQQTFYDWDDSN